MRVTRLFTMLCAVTAVFFLTSCAPRAVPPPFDPINLQPKLAQGSYVQKVDSFLVILDASGSMSECLRTKPAVYRNKFDLAKTIVSNMNQTIPDLKLQGGLRVFGLKNTLVYGMTDYTRAGLDKALGAVKAPDGLTPIGEAIGYGIKDLESEAGKIAVIVVSDGKDYPGSTPLAMAEKMKERYGERVCIYTILIGNDPTGKDLMDRLAQAGGCGFPVNDEEIVAADSMADYVEKVFLATAAKKEAVKMEIDGDDDGDGVRNSLDKCPNTPQGLKVDAQGCPLPVKEKVAIRLLVEFDHDKSIVKPLYDTHLQAVADFLTAYPTMKVMLEGHTDSQGSEKYNLGLSQRRAASVKKYLVDKFGIDAARISAVGYGESKPVAPNDTKEGRQKNRRVIAEFSPGAAK